MKKNTNLTKQRSSNIELMRIFMMLGIILHHLVVNSGLTNLYDFTVLPPKMIFCQLVGNYGKMIINCFTLITGYYMVKSNISLKKFLKIYLEYKFYYIIFYIIFVTTGYETFSMQGLMTTLFSTVFEFSRRYSGTYIVFYLFIPFINLLIKAMNKKQHQLLLGLCMLAFTVLPTLFDFYFSKTTYSFLGFMIVMYLVGAYISLYPNKYTESISFGAIGSFILFCISSLFILIVDFCGGRLWLISGGYLLYDCNKILAVSLAITLFILFKNLKIKNYRWINTIAASTFGILLIHTNSDTMRKFLWGSLLKCTEHYQMRSIQFILFVICAVIGIYLVCFIIDYLRIHLLEKPLFSFLQKHTFIK